MILFAQTKHLTMNHFIHSLNEFTVSRRQKKEWIKKKKIDDIYATFQAAACKENTNGLEDVIYQMDR